MAALVGPPHELFTRSGLVPSPNAARSIAASSSSTVLEHRLVHNSPSVFCWLAYTRYDFPSLKGYPHVAPSRAVYTTRCDSLSPFHCCSTLISTKIVEKSSFSEMSNRSVTRPRKTASLAESASSGGAGGTHEQAMEASIVKRKRERQRKHFFIW